MKGQKLPVARVMSFNIFNTLPPEEEIQYFSDIWANRADFNVATIKRYEPDIIGFQEFCPEHWNTYRAQFPEYQHYAADLNVGTVIFWKASRFERRDAGMFWLGENIHERKAAWGSADALCANWVKLKELSSGIEFLFLNTHLADDSELARVNGSQVILEQLALLNPNNDLPTMMTGDFNCNPGFPAYRNFLSTGFVDTFRAAGHGDSVETSTFHGFHGKDYFALEWGDELFWRVDWILTHDGAKQRLLTTSCTIIRDAAPPVYASDHYPVVTELRFIE
jgi:endonuclease/exonuclease/phosphatase family metal-dependent hydrolase